MDWCCSAQSALTSRRLSEPFGLRPIFVPRESAILMGGARRGVPLGHKPFAWSQGSQLLRPTNNHHLKTTLSPNACFDAGQRGTALNFHSRPTVRPWLKLSDAERACWARPAATQEPRPTGSDPAMRCGSWSTAGRSRSTLCLRPTKSDPNDKTCVVSTIGRIKRFRRALDPSQMLAAAVPLLEKSKLLQPTSLLDAASMNWPFGGKS